jgi:hypothetical protein
MIRRDDKVGYVSKPRKKRIKPKKVATSAAKKKIVAAVGLNPKKPKKHAVLKLPSLKVVGVRMNNEDNALFYLVRKIETDSKNYSVWIAVTAKPDKRGRKKILDLFPFYSTLTYL